MTLTAEHDDDSDDDSDDDDDDDEDDEDDDDDMSVTRDPGGLFKGSYSRFSPHPWARWGWTGSLRRWSLASPLCWPPSYG